MKHEHPAEAVELWTQDEARLGLKPVTRRVWAPKGERPTAHARPGYEWLWLFAAVHPASGRVFWLVLPYLNAQMMQRFLDAFAREHAPAGKRLVMVLDGASAHRARSLRVPERLTLVALPAYTPELNPTERLWRRSRKASPTAASTRSKSWRRLSARVVKRSVPRLSKSRR